MRSCIAALIPIILGSCAENSPPVTVAKNNSVSTVSNARPYTGRGRSAGAIAPQTKLLGKPVIVKAREPVIHDANGARGYLPVHNLNTQQGLALSSISCIFQDRAGNLWIGTYGGGVSRFDGQTFTNFTRMVGLAKNVVYSVCEDRDGNMWFGTDGSGADRYDGTSIKHHRMPDGQRGNTVRCILADKKGCLWFGTENGVYRKNAGGNDTIVSVASLAHLDVRSICEDTKGNIWFGTIGKGVRCFDGRAYSAYTASDGLSTDFVWSVAQDDSGAMWFGGNGEVSTLSGGQFKSFTINDGNKPVRSIAKGANGSLWFGVVGGGLVYYDGKFSLYSTANSGLSDNKVTCVFTDREGFTWAGTLGGGVDRFAGASLSYFTARSGLAGNHVRCVMEDKKRNLWFGTDGDGVSCFDGKSFRNYSKTHGLPDNNIWCMHEDSSGDMLFGTYGGGLSRFDGKRFENYSTAEGLSSNKVLCIVDDGIGGHWLGSDTGGVMHINGKTVTSYRVKNGLSHNSVWCGTRDKDGNLWLGTYGGGVTRISDGSFTSYEDLQNAVANNILCIGQDRSGNLWIGTDGGGIIRYDGESFAVCSTAEGLSNNEVYAMAFDTRGNLVVGTNLGLSVITGFEKKTSNASPDVEKEEHAGSEKALSRIGVSNKIKNTVLWSEFEPEFEDFNEKTGYPIKDVNTNAMICDSKGVIWAGCGDNRLVRLDYSALPKTGRAPTLSIQSIKLRNESVSWPALLDRSANNGRAQAAASVGENLLFGKTPGTESKKAMVDKFNGVRFSGITPFSFLPIDLVLPFRLNEITFDFAAISPASFSNFRYQYKLKGYDNDWSPPTEKTSATFGNMDAGEYTFMLRAKSLNGAWGDPLTYSFTVLPPWYRTWWAYTTGIVFAFTSVRLYIYRRERHLKREKARLTESLAFQKRIAEERSNLLSEITRRNKALEQFSYMISHNLRAPVASLLGLTNLAHGSLNEEESGFLMEGIRKSAGLLDEVIKDLAKILDKKGGMKENRTFVRFQDVVDEIGGEINGKDGGVAITTDFSRAEGMFTVKSYLQSIFYNLISNSVKYRRDDVAPVIGIASVTRPGVIEIVFSDNGVGIDLNTAGDRIFGLYSRFHNHVDGQGIGLFLVKSQVEILGGEISVASEPGRGTKFSIVFKSDLASADIHAV